MTPKEALELYKKPLPEDSFISGEHEMDNSFLFSFNKKGPEKHFLDTLTNRNVSLIGIGNVPNFRRKRNYIGVLLEDNETFEKFWFHVDPSFFIAEFIMMRTEVPQWLIDADKEDFNTSNSLDGLYLPDGF